MQHFSLKLLLGLISTGLCLASVTAFAGGDRTRLECRSDLALEDASAKARYEDERGRTKFSVEVEALSGGSFQAGDVFQIQVDGQMVGTITLEQAGIDVVGDVNFDTDLEPGDTELPFPANFPAVSRGSIVQVGAQFACDLQAR